MVRERGGGAGGGEPRKHLLYDFKFFFEYGVAEKKKKILSLIRNLLHVESNLLVFCARQVASRATGPP